MSKEKIFGRFVIEFFDDGNDNQIALGIKDYAYIDEEAPKEIQQSLSIVFKALHKNYPMLIIAESNQMKGLKQ